MHEAPVVINVDKRDVRPCTKTPEVLVKLGCVVRSLFVCCTVVLQSLNLCFIPFVLSCTDVEVSVP